MARPEPLETGGPFAPLPVPVVGDFDGPPPAVFGRLFGASPAFALSAPEAVFVLFVFAIIMLPPSPPFASLLDASSEIWGLACTSPPAGRE